MRHAAVKPRRHDGLEDHPFIFDCNGHRVDKLTVLSEFVTGYCRDVGAAIDEGLVCVAQ